MMSECEAPGSCCEQESVKDSESCVFDGCHVLVQRRCINLVLQSGRKLAEIFRCLYSNI